MVSIDNKKRHKTSKTGVFYRLSMTNGKKDKTYYIVYKNEHNKTVESKVGKESQGIGVNYVYNIYTATIQNIKLGDTVPVKRKSRKIFTFEEAFNNYIISAKSSKKSWKKDEELFKNHLDNFHKIELTSLKQKNFNNLKIEKLKTHSERTVQYILAVARQIINYAINNELVKNYVNPISNGRVKINRIDNANTGFFSKEQAKDLFVALKEYKTSSLQIYPLTVLLLHTGARFSEVASLTWEDINFKEKTIYFKKTKEGNERWISMSSLVLEVLKSLSTDNTLILPSSKGTQFKQMPDKLQEIIDIVIPNNKITVIRTKNAKLIELSDKDKVLLKQQRKKRLTVHSLRHTHASWMAMSGDFNLMEIRDELGHKNTKMTERYAHLLPQDRHRKTNELFDSL